MPRPPRPHLHRLTIPPPDLPQNLPSPSPNTPEATHTIPLTPPPQYRPSAPPARQPWHTHQPPSHLSKPNPSPNPKADRWAKPVHSQRAIRDEARRNQHQPQRKGNDIELQDRGEGDLESQGSTAAGNGKGKGYLGPRSSSCGRWVVVLVVCAVVVAVAFLVAHAVTSVR